MNFPCEKVSHFISAFENVTKNPEEFLEVKKDEGENVKALVKEIYDFTKNLDSKSNTGNALPELIIENFDEEQIWQEIELQNNDIIDKFESGVSWLSEKKDELIFPVRLKEEDDYHHANNEKQVSKKHNVDSEMEINMETDDKDIDNTDNESISDRENEIGSDDESSDIKVLRDKTEKDKKEKLKPSIVDDKFFKLSEMEDFLLAEEKKTDNTDFGIDLFEDIPSSDDEDEEKDKVRYRYKDFFAEPSADKENFTNKKSNVKLDRDSDSGSDNEFDDDELNINDKINDQALSGSENDLDVGKGEEEEEDDDDDDDDDDDVEDPGKAGKQVRFNLSGDEENENDESSNAEFIDSKIRGEVSDEDDSEEEDSDDDDSGNEKENRKGKTVEVKSTLEKRKERLSKHIQKLEEQALSEKPWQMKGEITATSRPQNSLLEEVLEFDVTSRPAPVMTEATTERLEDIIIRRIKDKAWDDVERKLKPVETVSEFKKRLVLDQEKSKLSLAQIYEQEYIKQRDAAGAVGLKAEEKEPEELPEHKQIKTMMVSLFSKLNALANFHYTPKPAAPDIKIVSNLPAVTMEEVAPVSASDATLLAPEEVLGKKKKELIGKEERTKTDKKRERRKKKHWQKTKRKMQEAKELSNEQKSKKYTVEKAAKDLKKLTNNRGVQIDAAGNKKAVKTSTAFFSRLQDEVKSKVHGSVKDKKTDKSIINAKKLKL